MRRMRLANMWLCWDLQGFVMKRSVPMYILPIHRGCCQLPTACLPALQVSFMGLCTLPPCILTGEQFQFAGGIRQQADSIFARPTRCPTSPLPSLRPARQQNTAPWAVYTTFCVRAAARPSARPLSPGAAALAWRWMRHAGCCTSTCPPRHCFIATSSRLIFLWTPAGEQRQAGLGREVMGCSMLPPDH